MVYKTNFFLELNKTHFSCVKVSFRITSAFDFYHFRTKLSRVDFDGNNREVISESFAAVQLAVTGNTLFAMQNTGYRFAIVRMDKDTGGAFDVVVSVSARALALGVYEGETETCKWKNILSFCLILYYNTLFYHIQPLFIHLGTSLLL